VASDVGAGPDEEPVEPGIEPLDVAQRRQIAPGPDQRLLGGILREFGVAQDEASGRVQPIDGAARQDAEGLAVSASRPVDELRLHASLPSEATDLVASHGTATDMIGRFQSGSSAPGGPWRATSGTLRGLSIQGARIGLARWP